VATPVLSQAARRSPTVTVRVLGVRVTVPVRWSIRPDDVLEMLSTNDGS
jgi:hypothetical protein